MKRKKAYERERERKEEKKENQLTSMRGGGGGKIAKKHRSKHGEGKIPVQRLNMLAAKAIIDVTIHRCQLVCHCSSVSRAKGRPYSRALASDRERERERHTYTQSSEWEKGCNEMMKEAQETLRHTE